MNRSEYWGRVILLYVGLFVAGFFIGAINNGTIPEGLFMVIQLGSMVYMWMIGYERCRDAGIHGGWAFFAPILIGTIVLGCFRSSSVISVQTEQTEQTETN